MLDTKIFHFSDTTYNTGASRMTADIKKNAGLHLWLCPHLQNTCIFTSNGNKCINICNHSCYGNGM